MKKKLVFATNNIHKLEEAKAILKDKVNIVSLKNIECFDDIPETANTIEDNALLKAKYINKHFNIDCFADDTGLEIEALNGEPGVYSARYAGIDKDDKANIKKVLNNMQGKDNRSAQFKTIIALILDGKKYSFEGIIKGEITEKEYGNSGFGYDSIFKPLNSDYTFAEMSNDEKNKISHRAIALNKLNEFLNTYQFIHNMINK